MRDEIAAFDVATHSPLKVLPKDSRQPLTHIVNIFIYMYIYIYIYHQLLSSINIINDLQTYTLHKTLT